MNKLLVVLLLVSGTAQAGDWGNDSFITNNDGWMSSSRTIKVAHRKPTKLETVTSQTNQDSSEPVCVTPVKESNVSNVEFKPAGEVNVLKVDNPEYVARRAEAIKKPGAVIAQTTIN